MNVFRHWRNVIITLQLYCFQFNFYNKIVINTLITYHVTAICRKKFSINLKIFNFLNTLCVNMRKIYKTKNVYTWMEKAYLLKRSDIHHNLEIFIIL